MKKYANVLFPIPLNTSFTYKIPESLIEAVQPGVRVLVSFGHRKKVGFVSETVSTCSFPKIKPVLDVLNPEISLPASILCLAKWMAEYYICGEGEALEVFFPPFVDGRKSELVEITESGRDIYEKNETGSKRGKETNDILKKIVTNNPITKKRLESFLKRRGELPSTIDRLIKQGLINISSEITLRSVKKTEGIKSVNPDPVNPIRLSESQKRATTIVSDSIKKGEYKTFLLHGVTGSGKTEVYLRCTEFTLDLGRQVIILVPEIGLTYQMMGRFCERFGEKVSIIHSALSPVQKFNEWKRIRSGEVSVVIGARSAVLAPFSDTGLIIVDEEHDSSYKQEDSPRYNGRDVAVFRGAKEGAVVLLGSATPSLETHYNVIRKKYTLLTLPERVDNRTMPKEEVIEMKGSSSAGIISETLRFKMEERVEMGEQTLLFLNRRGSSTFVHCVTCGFVWKCKNCDISLTFYKKKGSLSCHYCGYELPVTRICPSCKGVKIEYKGFGTQKVEEEARNLFPSSEVARIDRDSTSKKGELEAILNKVRKKEIDILVGTQMISKGHDFPDITLVGILAADNMLNIPDFRAGEKTFQQIVQVAGRSGRGKKKGEVFAQTYKPGHYAIKFALSNNISEFYEQELSFREELNYPPFSRLVCLRFEGAIEHKVISEAHRVKQLLNKLLKNHKDVEILGPAKAVLFKIQNRYRIQLLIKAIHNSRLRGIIREVVATAGGGASKQGVRVVVDVDPLNML